MPTFRKRPIKRARRLRNNATDAERKLWRYLSRRGLNGSKFSRQMPIGPYICDFLCRERHLIIEVDGGQHAGNRRDLARTTFLEKRGYRVLRFWNNEVLQNMEGVLAVISAAIGECPPPAPSRPREGDEKRHAAPDISRLREGKSRVAAKGWAHPQPPPASGRGL